MIYQQKIEYYTKNNFCKIFSLQSVTRESVANDIHRHNFYQIIILQKGSMKHWIDCEMKEVKAPYISVIFPNQIHKMEMNEEACADIIMFDNTVFCSSILANELKEYNINLQSRINHVIIIPKEAWTDINMLLQSISTMMPNLNMIRKMQVKFMIKIILLKIIDIAPSTSALGNIDADWQIYQKFREAVDEEFATQRKVVYYADKIGVSTKKLTAICDRYTGLSPLGIIHEKLSAELKKAFVEEGLLLKEIAFRFGFSSQSALNKFIERHFGYSPQEWRNELEKNMMGRY